MGDRALVCKRPLVTSANSAEWVECNEAHRACQRRIGGPRCSRPALRSDSRWRLPAGSPPRLPRPVTPPKAVEPLDRQPYRIRVLLAIDPEARFDARRREALVDDWQNLVRRFVEAPWIVQVAATGQAG